MLIKMPQTYPVVGIFDLGFSVLHFIATFNSLHLQMINNISCQNLWNKKFLAFLTMVVQLSFWCYRGMLTLVMPNLNYK